MSTRFIVDASGNVTDLLSPTNQGKKGLMQLSIATLMVPSHPPSGWRILLGVFSALVFGVGGGLGILAVGSRLPGPVFPLIVIHLFTLVLGVGLVHRSRQRARRQQYGIASIGACKNCGEAVPHMGSMLGYPQSCSSCALGGILCWFIFSLVLDLVAWAGIVFGTFS